MYSQIIVPPYTKTTHNVANVSMSTVVFCANTISIAIGLNAIFMKPLGHFYDTFNGVIKSEHGFRLNDH